MFPDRLIYLIGQPGSGKSTLMSKLTLGMTRHAIAPCEGYPVALDVLTDKKTGVQLGVELGVRRGAFSGTDALPSSIIDKAAPWIASRPFTLVLAEGARLANRRFLEAAIDGGYHLTLALLDHDKAEDWRHKRSRKLGRTQDAGWVKGRLTASRNLADQLTTLSDPGREFHGKVDVLRGAPDDLFSRLAPLVSEQLP